MTSPAGPATAGPPDLRRTVGECRARRARAGRRACQGAALLLAMLVLALTATLAAGLVRQQAMAVQLEQVERSRAQAAWILAGALDWARLLLREDARQGGADHLGEPWAVPLAEARLSTFLAADRDNTLEPGLDAFLSGSISDAQARYNLRNLLDAQGKALPGELKVLQRLCELAGVPGGTAQRLADGLAVSWRVSAVPAAPGQGAGNGDPGSDAAAGAAFAGGSSRPLPVERVAQLSWLGLDDVTVARLAPFVEVLPQRAPVNVNTASREVLAAVIEGLDLGSAERLVQSRERAPFRQLADLVSRLPEGIKAEESRVAVSSRYFEVRGRLRLEGRVLEERSLVERPAAGGTEPVRVLRRERGGLVEAR